jgi:hypothetical protein
LIASEVSFLSAFSAVSIASDVPPEDILLGAGILAVFWLIPIQLIVFLCWVGLRRNAGFATPEAALIGALTGLATAAVAVFTKFL